MKIKETTLLLSQMRELMGSSRICNHQLHALLVPSSDAHQSEYLADCDERRAFISGFTGSAGTAVITLNQAALWTDGRYFLQASKQLDSNWTLMRQGEKETPSIEDWLCQVLPNDSFVGVNPFLYSSGAWAGLEAALQKKGHRLVPTPNDFVDKVWVDRPGRPLSDLMLVDEKVSGKSCLQKVEDLRKEMFKKEAKWLVVTALDDIAWLFNLRAADIEYNPVFFAYAVVGMDSIHLFIDTSRVTPAISTSFKTAVTIHPYEDVIDFLTTTCNEYSGNTWVAANSSYAISSAVNSNRQVMTAYNPVHTMKCCKTDAEVEGMKLANVLDGVALCRYFHWLETEVHNGNVTEFSAAMKSLQFRREEDNFVSLSFSTISSSGPTGAIIHYQPSEVDDKPLKADQIYLCDSGAQYTCGTTDTTRTVHFGNPTAYEKECFTRVLKGHIALATAVFPSGTKGYWLDTLARMHLWKAGLDYKHGTGHGVGTFLNVHEGPVGCYIGNSDRVVQVAADVEIKPGMVITDEPGYYEEGKFGIRIENALLTKSAATSYGAKNSFMEFEVIALAPICSKLIDVDLLSSEEKSWLNEYHQRCRNVLGSELKKRGFSDVYDWLHQQTVPL